MSTRRPLRRRSLRHTLLLVLFPGMLLLMLSEIGLAWRASVDAANSAYDRSLLGAIKAIDSHVSTESGGLAVELPYRMLEFFELTASGQVFYRVATEDRLVEIGNADLPAPAAPLVTGRPQFMDAAYFDEPVRVGSYARPLALARSPDGREQRVVIQVAETLGSRNAFIRALVWQSVQRDFLLLVVATVLLTLAIRWAMRPLQRLRGEIQARSPDDLAPVDASGIPADVQPMVEAMNHHILRNRLQAEARRRFIDDASHQLRTPLTTLATQVGYALRETDTERLRDVLVAIKGQLDDTVRQTNQMLSLGRTDALDAVLEPVELAGLARGLTRTWWPVARDRGLDLGLQVEAEPVQVAGDAALLREALTNLLHNAVRYTPPGGSVTVHVRREGGHALLDVVDTGPGIPADELARVGERFFRASNVGPSGSGLGLAIVASIAKRHGGDMRVSAGAGGQGLSAGLRLPLLPPPGPAGDTG